MKSMLYASVAAVALTAAPAFAQAADESNPGEIVVTAQKRSESLQSVPVAVSVISGEDLADTARPGIESAAQLVPSLNFLKSGSKILISLFMV